MNYNVKIVAVPWASAITRRERISALAEGVAQLERALEEPRATHEPGANDR